MTENKTPSCWNWLVFTKSQCQRCREKKELNKPCHLKPLYNMSGPIFILDEDKGDPQICRHMTGTFLRSQNAIS